VKVIILGGPGIGMIAASIIDRVSTAAVLGFLNDVLPVGARIGKYKAFEVLGRSTDLSEFLRDPDCRCFVAYVGLGREKATFEKIVAMQIPDEKLTTIIDPSAVIPKGYCSIGSGCLFGPLAQLSADTTVGRGCMLLPNAYVGHDSILSDYAHLATNAVVGANVRVGKGVHVGSNATIREYVHIGDFSLVGAGAVVLKDVPPNSVVVGNPARILREGAE
jgi:acetyltransferase EpsM